MAEPRYTPDPNSKPEPVSEALMEFIETVSYDEQPTDPKDYLTAETDEDPDE